MKVLKFGGTSVANAARVTDVIDIVKASVDAQGVDGVAVVFSAAAGITDSLVLISQKAAGGDESFKADLSIIAQKHLEIVRGVIPVKDQGSVIGEVKALLNELSDFVQGAYLVHEISPRTLDSVLSFGERLSAYIICEALKAAKVKARYIDARKVLISNNRHGSALVDKQVSYANIQSESRKSDGLMVVTGFIASTSSGDTTTLGRGGSDLTAALFGAALSADEIEIWSDVDGVMTADPRKVKDALRIPQMTYEEAMEMSHFGAKVIYPPTMMPALEKRIPIRIKNTLNPRCEGTLIEASANATSHGVRGISSIDQVALMNVQGSGMVGIAGIAERLFKALAREHISVILISQASSEHSICVAIDPLALTKAEDAVNGEFALEINAGHIERVKCDIDLSVVAVVGENMRKVPGISGRVFSALGKNGVNVSAISQGSSERNISLVVRKSDVTKAVKCLHDAFFLSGTMTLNIYVIGIGLIGRALMSQMAWQRDILREHHSLELRVHGLSNTKTMLLSDEPIDLQAWSDRLGEKAEAAHAKSFIAGMVAANRPNSVFVDCTSSDDIVESYDDVLKASISIVTPNKKANSSTFERFTRLRGLAKAHGSKFIYEANVGAGLPVLSTIKNLLLSGDKILRVEAMLSGTLSYLFNELSSHKTFSAVVREAMSLGYTEPDPREDLSGMDVARKLLILGREIGLPMELGDIRVDPFLPQNEANQESVEEWLISLNMQDPHFEARRQIAAQSDKVLRFVATLENGYGHARLIEVSKEHPCFASQGSDNVISITTERYRERPLVIKGPGAGAEVTAAQVFADIIRVSNHLN